MCDESEIDELYDEFLDLDWNPFVDSNCDAKIIAQELNKSEQEVDHWNLIEIQKHFGNNNNEESELNNYNENGDINNINNNHINIKKVFSETDNYAELDFLNQNSLDYVGILDKNGKGKVEIRNEFSSLKFGNCRPSRPTSLFTKAKECEVDTEQKEVDEQRTSPDESSNNAAFHRSDWGPESLGLWHSGPSSLSLGQATTKSNIQQDLCNDVAFSASFGSGSQSLDPFTSSARRAYSHQQLGAKVEMVYSLLSMLGTSNRSDMSKTLLAMSSSPESCLAMRQSGCLPLLIQLIHSPELDIEVRRRAAEALHNIVHAQTDEKKRRREARVLKLLQQIREYCDNLKILSTDKDSSVEDEPEKHPVSAIEALMKFSFDAEHRQAMCSLGGLHAIAELIQLDHEVHGSMNDNPLCITLRRYAGMALTNLIFGDGNNKALLCSFSKFMKALVSQLMSPNEDLRQVTASVLRNLSWRADSESKQSLREIGTVTALMVAAMEGKKESTLKSILSALWNLSGHCSMNKVDVCAVPGAVAFLVKMLKYKAASNTLAVVENAGGILRNISSHIAIREDYRQILRDNNCFEILLEQLKSSSLTIVSNACGTLWNLSARCTEDQRRLWEMGAISMLRSLIQSKHKMISMGSSAALKNLLAANPGGNMFNHMDSTAKGLGLQNLPTLFVRKQRALEQELDINLSETCDNIEPSSSPIHSEKLPAKPEERRRNITKRSDSHESVTSTQSDSAYERVNQLMVKNERKMFENKNVTMHGSLSENQSRRSDEQKLMRRYKSSMIPTPAFKKLSQEKKNAKRKGDNARSNADNDCEGNVMSKKPLETKEKKGIPVLQNRIKPKQEIQGLEPSCGQCYSLNNFHSTKEEDLPINYGLKYSENGVYARKMNNQNHQNCEGNIKEKENYEGYPDYAETDLDQPTDFSLKYGEETSSDEEMKNQDFTYFEGGKTKESGYYNGQPESDDTTRTYYTEGTPYNFSMSDLRIDHSEATENNGNGPAYLEEKGDSRKLTPEESSASSANEKDCQNLYVDNAGDYRNRVKSLPRDFESGISTPERPIQYCEEGTPGGCFSRVSSLSSLSGGKEPLNKNSSGKLYKKNGEKDSKKSLKDLETEDSLQNKAVTFGLTQQYEPADETPLMFSRSSSINSLSSFEEIHQSIPDDRSSVVSDFSRMTSGIISPSELPDSPTQTVPPSPKQCKASAYFPGKSDTHKKSVFEDAVATYKQEDTPIEFSRATSLSSLNIENSVKQDFNLKTNSSASSVVSVDESKVREEKHKDSLEKTQNNDLKEQIVPDKNELEREKLELEAVTEVDESLLVDCVKIGIQENRRRPKCPEKKRQETYMTTASSQAGNRQIKQFNGVSVKASGRGKCQNEAGKMYSTYEESDDVVHTYYTEGTPANVSHAGSNSDLSNLSMVTNGLTPLQTMEDTSDDGSFSSGDTENMLAECIQSGMPKAKHQKEKGKPSKMKNSIDLTRMDRPDLTADAVHVSRVGMINPDVYVGHQNCSDFMRRKDHHLTAKDEISTFATENSPCNFSIRSSLSDLTVNSVDSPVCISRPEVNRDQPAQGLSHGQVTAKSTSNSIFIIESEKEGKAAEENRAMFKLPQVEKEPDFWDERKSAQSHNNNESTFPMDNEYPDTVSKMSRHESLSSLGVEIFDSSEPTPLEQALLEQCIHSGMPHKTHSREIKNYKSYDDSRLVRMRNVDVSETDSPKNVQISSAIADETVEADEKKSSRIVVGQEVSKATDQTFSISFNLKCQFSSELKDGSDTLDGNEVENLNSSYGGHTWSEDYTSPNENSAASIGSGKIEGLRLIGETSDDSTAKGEVLLPNFRIGSEMRDPKFLQSEASKICREIRKYQELDMSCSITSEVSQMSCNSFLDSGEFSFIDLSNETGDLDGSESLNLNKGQRKLNNLPLRTAAGFEEPMSLPSIGSIKSDLFKDVDLESSIVSVASLTSEVAENFSRAKEITEFNGEKTVENALDSPVTVFDKGDDTLNAETIGSDTEIFDDENSIMSEDNLPLDTDESKESTPKLSKKLTPKEKRQVLQDRFRTYTIHDFKPGVPIENTSEKQMKKTTPKERRLHERDRFLTRVLGKENLNCKTDKENIRESHLEGGRGTGEPIDSSTLVFRKKVSLQANSFDGRECYSRRTVSEEIHLTTHILPESPAERKEIIDNAKLVAISLKTAARDVDPEVGFVSDSDAEESFKTFAIDTATYNKTTPTEICYRPSDDKCQDSQDSEDEIEKKGPKILKPEDKPEEELSEGTVKAVRGRRKQLYSSPAKRFVQNAISMPVSPNITPGLVNAKKLSTAITKSLPNVPKTIQKVESPPICREGTFTKEEGTTVKQTAGFKQPRLIPVLNKCKTGTANSSMRHKSAPPLKNNRINSEGVKPTRPVSSYTAKTSDKPTSSSSNFNRQSSGSGAVTGSKLPGSGSSSYTKKPSSSVCISTNMKTSASNQSIKSIGSAKSNCSVRARSTTHSPKSQSNGSLDSDTISDKSKGKPKTPKKEVTSKIASLWKKVEDTKRKEKNVKDNRVWITGDKDAKPDDEQLVVEKEEILELTSGKVVRSSTFQALGEENTMSDDELRKKRHRNSGDFYSSKWQTERSEGRNIVSAVVPPYNYSPPSTAQMASPTVKQMDTFHKGSLKVTTV